MPAIRPRSFFVFACAASVFALACSGNDSSGDIASAPTTDADTSSDGRASDGSADGAFSDASAPSVGSPCTAANECPAGGSGTPVCFQSGYPGGYCAVQSCAPHGHDCPNDPGSATSFVAGSSKCVQLSSGTACVALCQSNADCRTGYTCTSLADAAGHGQVLACTPTTD